MLEGDRSRWRGRLHLGGMAGDWGRTHGNYPTARVLRLRRAWRILGPYPWQLPNCESAAAAGEAGAAGRATTQLRECCRRCGRCGRACPLAWDSEEIGAAPAAATTQLRECCGCGGRGGRGGRGQRGRRWRGWRSRHAGKGNRDSNTEIGLCANARIVGCFFDDKCYTNIQSFFVLARKKAQ
jgi:hypothetical protein